jgi:hypothetical protein
MSDKWEDKGHHEGIPILGDLGQMITGTEERHVVNSETGEEKIAIIGPGQTLGDAIANGQLRDDDC